MCPNLRRQSTKDRPLRLERSELAVIRRAAVDALDATRRGWTDAGAGVGRPRWTPGPNKASSKASVTKSMMEVSLSTQKTFSRSCSSFGIRVAS